MNFLAYLWDKMFWVLLFAAGVVVIVWVILAWAKWRRGVFAQIMNHIPYKLPTDFTTTLQNSTEWVAQSYCPKCKATVGGLPAHVCKNCGDFFGTTEHIGLRAYRRIWNGDQWIHQYRYKDGVIDLRRGEPL